MPCPGLIIFYNYLFSWYIYAINVNYNGFMETRYNIGTVAKRRKVCNKLIANMIENSYLSKI